MVGGLVGVVDSVDLALGIDEVDFRRGDADCFVGDGVGVSISEARVERLFRGEQLFYVPQHSDLENLRLLVDHLSSERRNQSVRRHYHRPRRKRLFLLTQ